MSPTSGELWQIVWSAFMSERMGITCAVLLLIAVRRCQVIKLHMAEEASELISEIDAFGDPAPIGSA